MRLKKAVITAVLGIGLYTMSFAGLDKGLVYADTTEVVYKAFDDKVSFSDKYFIYQWGMENRGDFKYNEQIGGKLVKQPVTSVKAVSGIDISLPEARAKYSGGRRETIVAIIDTGVDYRHEDLQNVLWVNKGEIPGNGIDDDGNGYVAPRRPAKCTLGK